MSKYSKQGGTLLQKLSYLINEYAANPTQAFYDSLSALRAAALTLPSDTEKMTVGIPIAVADSSSRFWAMGGDFYAKMLLIYMSWPTNFASQRLKPQFKLNKGALLRADVVGAYTGAEGGLGIGGPGGALAGGTLGAATGSLYDICDQALGYFTGWW